MLFGSKETFGIEVMVEPHLVRPSNVWGRMQVWCQGISIGDYTEEHCGLYDSYSEFKSLRKLLPDLWRIEFENLENTDLWNLLDAHLYGYHGDLDLEDTRTVEECRSDWDKYGAFNFLTNWGEQFDRDGKSFIFCRPSNIVQILNRSLQIEKKMALYANLSDVDKAIGQFIIWFESETLRLS